MNENQLGNPSTGKDDVKERIINAQQIADQVQELSNNIDKLENAVEDFKKIKS